MLIYVILLWLSIVNIIECDQTSTIQQCVNLIFIDIIMTCDQLFYVILDPFNTIIVKYI